jgi:hypothetical protein
VAVEFIDHLVAKFPALESLLSEHGADNFGEVLPHVFIGELTRDVVGTFIRRQGTNGEGGATGVLRVYPRRPLVHAASSR